MQTKEIFQKHPDFPGKKTVEVIIKREHIKENIDVQLELSFNSQDINHTKKRKIDIE